MKRYRILAGHLSEEIYSRWLDRLQQRPSWRAEEVADLQSHRNELLGRATTPGPHVEETVHYGLPCARHQTAEQRSAFDLTSNVPHVTDGVAGDSISLNALPDYASKQQVDLMHVLQWGHLKGCLFEAALRARIPLRPHPLRVLVCLPCLFCYCNTAAPSAAQSR